MRLPFLLIAIFFCASAQTQELFNFERQSMALEKIKKIVVSENVTRFADNSSTVITTTCSSRNESIVATDPSSQENMRVRLTTYTSTGSSKTVIVLPPTGGVNKLDYKYAEEICKKGMNAIILLTWEGDDIKEVDPGMHDRNALRAIVSVRSLINSIDKKQKLGIFGTSVGGILGSLVIGLEPRLETGLFLVAGAGMSKIMVTSDEKTLTGLRDLRMKHYNLKSEGDYWELLDKNVFIDPLDFVNYSGTKKVNFIVSDYDTTVSTESQYDLVNVWGGDHLIFKKAPFLFNHFAAILHSSVWWTQDIVDFFETNM
jgi:hypothetical protein